MIKCQLNLTLGISLRVPHGRDHDLSGAEAVRGVRISKTSLGSNI